MTLKVWQIYLLIPLLVALGIYSYYDLKAWEESGGVHSMNRLLWFVYDIGGKPLVALVFIAMGGFLAWGLVRFHRYDAAIRENESKR